MRWLVHGTLSPAVSEALKRHGDTPQELPVADGGAAVTDPADVLQAANKAQLDIMTNDAALTEAAFGEDAPMFGRSIVYLQLEGEAVEQDDAVDRLFARYKRLTPGRLYTVTASRVKVRQLPGRI